VTTFASSKCYGCTQCRYGGNAGDDRTRCLHPGGDAESHALGSRLAGEDAAGPLALKLNVLASLRGFDFPTSFDPLAIDACEGFDPIMQRRTHRGDPRCKDSRESAT
jgi:hypothetical protein